MHAHEIRETYLRYFTERDHRALDSASLVPAATDVSVLLTTAGMQPLKPYFLGVEKPPSPRMTSCQKCFRTTDIDQVGSTARHLTFFEMLGNFSIGDYFKADAIRHGWELSIDGLGLDPADIWVTVFGGDEDLGLGPDQEAIDHWLELGVPQERIVQLGRDDNFWQAGSTGPCGPCSEMYLDRGEQFDGQAPGDDGERFLEYWNHVFMTYELGDEGSLEPLPARNIDTGMGLERMAAILQGVDSVFETDGFRPLIALAEELSGRGYRDDERTTRAMRIVADHARGTAFLLADGVVPSNEDRGYILRRIMRRAIQQGGVLELPAPFLERFVTVVIETMAGAYPELQTERDTILRWVRAEEEHFAHTLEHGSGLLDQALERARAEGRRELDAETAFQLHDTYGFPFELTSELVREAGLGVDEIGFQRLMREQRERARAGAGGGPAVLSPGEITGFAAGARPTRFVGYETLRAETTVAAVEAQDGRTLVKLEESPFYPEGGGQISDDGVLEWEGGTAEVASVFRLGDDQALAVPAGVRAPDAGQRVQARVDHRTRHATMRNHTATHLLHAALRDVLGTHVRQAGSAVRPDKLRFDFSHHGPLTDAECARVVALVNGWIADADPVRALTMTLPEAKKLGAMALFGEKYGEWVRVVEVQEVSRELCGGTHVANTAEIGIFALTAETSSAANVRRIEAITGPAAIEHFGRQAAELLEIGRITRSADDPVAGVRRLSEQVEELREASKRSGQAEAAGLAEELEGQAEEIEGVHVLTARTGISDQREMLDLADKLKQRLGEATVVLGGAGDGKVGLVASFTTGAIERGASASTVVREAAQLVGGGGGGRDDVAQAGGRDPDRLDEALVAARGAIERVLRG
ncbi:MAG: alanine--tRNA ligase [Solirubrobacterales bacterium]